MNIIGALQAGIGGAGGGTARVYQRGTSTKASYYLDAEASGSPSTDDVLLDADGRASVYVNTYVDVQVFAQDGTPVATFTQMDSASNVEVVSPVVTGTDYASGLSGTSKPVDLNTHIGRWQDSAGTASVAVKDWKVAFGGSAVSLSSALGPLTNLLFNVQDPAYGATGNGTTDDSTAIQAAIDAAKTAGGGIVFFPPGDYRCNTGLDASGVTLQGADRFATTITINHATQDLVAFGVANRAVAIRGMRLRSAQSGTGSLIVIANTSAPTIVENVYCDGSLIGVPITSNAAATKGATVRDCVFSLKNGEDAVDWSTVTGGRLLMESCRFVAPATYSSNNGVVYGKLVDLRTCEFDMSATTSGTVQCFVSSSTTLDSSVLGCKFVSSGGATITGMVLGSYVSGGRFVESGNVMPTFLDTNFTAYSYDNLPPGASTYGGVQLLTRESRYLTIEHSETTSFDLTEHFKQYGAIYIENDSGGTIAYQVFTSGNTVPAGGTARLTVRAEGSGLTNLSITGAEGDGGGHAVSSNQYTSWHLVWANALPHVFSENQNYT